MKIICMIPARLGSKRIPNKNLRLLDGKPLACHIAEKALASKCFDDIFINSESDIFSSFASEMGIGFHKRPEELASESATNDIFVREFLSSHECDVLVQINPTSPLITVEEIQRFVGNMTYHRWTALHSVKEERIEGLFRGQPLNYDPCKDMPRSQDLEPIVLFCSAMMAWDVSAYHGTYGGNGRIGYFFLKGLSTIDIDTEDDWIMAELAIAHRKRTANA